jgi:hypothetical protein
MLTFVHSDLDTYTALYEATVFSREDDRSANDWFSLELRLQPDSAVLTVNHYGDNDQHLNEYTLDLSIAEAHDLVLSDEHQLLQSVRNRINNKDRVKALAPKLTLCPV